VSIAITPQHVELAETARRFLENRSPRDVVRAGIDGTPDALPPFWDELRGLGWLGLHVEEAYGGQGYGFAELAVVVAEMARAAAPGPFLPTVLASSAVARGGSEGLRKQLLPDLADGSAIGAISFPRTSPLGSSARDGDGSVRVSGTARPVPGAAGADWLVLAARGEDGETWCVIPREQLEIAPLPSLDLTRPAAAVTATEVLVPQANQLALSRDEVAAVFAALAAAECAGGSGWCLDTATAYAKVREQFGRPIGQFQAVKHLCAGMLVATEQARAVAWDAARALDLAGASTVDAETSLVAAVAGAVAPDAFVRVAKDCIQVLGGIGFTWEHDAHLYLRRATALRQLAGGPGPWRERVTALAREGTRSRLKVDLPAGVDEVRSEIRSLAEVIASRPETERRAGLVETGLFMPHWPEPWGRSATAVEQLIIDEELRRAGLRRPHLAVGAWAAPTIAAHGTPEQQERWVRPTLLGDIQWCQLFSEPGAGSDLASLTTRAVRTEGGWLVSGQKVWTTFAAQADWGMCLARTEPKAPKHLGITYFVMDMRSEGIEVRPLREMTGEALFNEVFLSEVFVADDCVVGEVNGGWQIARATLANERVAMGSGASFGGGVESLLTLTENLAPDAAGAVAMDTLGALLAESRTVALLGLRSTLRAVGGLGPGPESSVRKLLSAEHDQRTQEFGLSLLGGEGATTDGPAAQWSYGFLANRCLTIAGGTSEVQRNVIAERLLGLPRDPEPRGSDS
jgi:3-oxochol-4-en-24-oyl-CoA dehydrogenase